MWCGKAFAAMAMRNPMSPLETNTDPLNSKRPIQMDILDSSLRLLLGFRVLEKAAGFKSFQQNRYGTVRMPAAQADFMKGVSIENRSLGYTVP